MTQRKTPTMQDVARHAGVSQPTASQALGADPGKYRIASSTVKRVRQAALDLGYRPNGLARAMRAGRFGNIALLLSTHRGRSYLPQSTLHGICAALSEQDLHLIMAKLPDEKLTDAGFVPKALREWCCDAMMILYTDSIPPKMIDLIEEMDLPAIWLNRKQDYDCVYPDDLALGRQATQRLLDVGHKRIAYLDWGAGWKQLDQAHYSQRDRQNGYVEAMEAAGLSSQPIRREDSDIKTTPQELLETMGRLLQAEDRPTALVTSAHDYARRAIAAARARGLRVPEDLSVVTVADGPQTTDDGTAIDAVVVPECAYGEAGVAAVLDKLERSGKVRLAPRVVEPAPPIEGRTVAPPDHPKHTTRQPQGGSE